MVSLVQGPEEAVRLAKASPPFTRRVVFAPQLQGRNPGLFLVLDCGHSTDWNAAQPVPAYVECTLCRLDGSVTAA
jgi:hypothetical protein